MNNNETISSEKKIGIVKWFNNQKGYGFISQNNGKEEVFVHFSSIVMKGYKTLKAGQPVTFEVKKGPKGLHATNLITNKQLLYAVTNGA